MHRLSTWSFIALYLVFSVGALAAPPPEIIGTIDKVAHSSKADGSIQINGWACAKGVATSLYAHLYLGANYEDGGAFLSTTLASASTEPAVRSACGVATGSYRFSIQVDEATARAQAGKSIFIYGATTNGQSVALLPASGGFRLPYATARTSLAADNARLVLMQYEPWFGPNTIAPNTKVIPILSSENMKTLGFPGYDSADPVVLATHQAWLEELGVDALVLDHSNSVNTQFAYQPQPYGKILNNISSLYGNFAKSGTWLKIVPLLGAFEVGTLTVDGPDGLTPFERQLNFYASLIKQYPNSTVGYSGKPLIIVYTPAPLDLGPKAMWRAMLDLVKNKGYANQFTFRVMSGVFDSTPGVAQPNRVAGLSQVSAGSLWSWFDRLQNPTYTTSPTKERVEVFTASVVTQGFGTETFGSGPGNYNPTASLLNDGATFNRFIELAKQLSPTFLMLHQFNEFRTDPLVQDDGYDCQTMTDIEPTAQCGYRAFIATKAGLLAYRQSVKDTRPLYRLDSANDFLQTTSLLAALNAVGAGYAFSGSAYLIYQTSGWDRIPLYRCRMGTAHFASVDPNCEGQVMEELLGYLRAHQGPSLAPLYRLSNGSSFLLSPSPTEGTAQGFSLQGILGYFSK